MKDAGFKLKELKNIDPVSWNKILSTSDLGNATDGISTKLKSAISSAIKNAGDGDGDGNAVKLNVTADTSKAEAVIAAMQKAADTLGKSKPEITASADTSSANKSLDSLDSYANTVCRDRSMTISVNRVYNTTYNTKRNTTSKSSGGKGGAAGLIKDATGKSTQSISGTRAVYDDGTVGLASLASAIDDDYGVSVQGIYDSVSNAVSGMSALSLGLGDDVRSMSRRLGSGVTVNMSGNDSEIAGLLRSIAKNTKGGQGIYLDGGKLVGGTADAYDRKMAQRERLSARGVSI